MDRQIIREKIESLRRCIARVKSRCPAAVEQLAADIDAQDIVSVNLSRAVQIAVDIASHLIADSDLPPPETMGEAFTRLHEAGVISAALADRMRSAVGFRNIVIHQYRAIDWQIAFAICTQHIGDFEQFAAAIVAAVFERP